MKFREKLDAIVAKNNSLLCVGLDPDISKIPVHFRNDQDVFFQFNKAIIEATHDLVCTYKPNIAFYEAEGVEGLQQLKKTIEYIKSNHPNIPILLDAKRGDIGNTNSKYAKAIYEYWDVDATTVYPHLGLDSVKPFLEYKDKLTILLIKTSNPDAKTFQSLNTEGEPFYYKMAQVIAKWPYDNIGIMIGATYPEELAKVRSLFPNSIFLSPGIGAQAGDIGAAIKAGLDKQKKGIMFNASRSVIFAASGMDFAEKAREQAQKLKEKINQHR